MFDGLGPCPEQVRNTAEMLGFGQALRRLASTAAVLADINDPRPARSGSLFTESHATYLDTPMCDNGVAWIWVRPANRKRGETSHSAMTVGASCGTKGLRASLRTCCTSANDALHPCRACQVDSTHGGSARSSQRPPPLRG